MNRKPGDCGYLALYKGQRLEIWTEKGIYDAQKQAAAHFKVPQSRAYQISVTLCVQADGTEVVHTPTE